MSQIYLHSEKFDVCRICMLEPANNRNVKFTRIFPVDDGEDFTLHRQIEEMFGDKIEKDDIKPKIICENCQSAMSAWLEIKKKFAESAIFFNYLAGLKLTLPTTSNALHNSSLNSNNEETPTRVQPETKKTELLPLKKNALPNSSLNSNNEETPTRVQPETKKTELLLLKKNALPNSSLNSNNEETPTRVQPETKKTELLPLKKNAFPNSSLNSNNEETPTRVQPETKKTKLLLFKKRIDKNKFECKTGNVQNNRHPSSYKLFTCLRPSCNLIFQSFDAFKFHYRKHFACEDKKMCWVCCIPFSNVSKLRLHQVKNCHTPGKFKCYECYEKFDDLEDLSIHKFIYHNSHLVSCKNSEITIECPFCRKKIVIYAFKNHLRKFH